jgi:hypothetical protein
MVAMVIKASPLLLTVALFFFNAPTFAQSGSPVLRPPSTPLLQPPDQEMSTRFLRYWGLKVLTDARIGIVKAALQLTPEQEKLGPL